MPRNKGQSPQPEERGRRIVSRYELGSLIHTALRISLEQQQKLLNHKCAAQLLPVVTRLARFNRELEEWYSGKYHLRENDRCGYFLSQAEEIEAQADHISEQIWEYAPVSLIPIFHRIRDLRVQKEKGDSFPKQLRAQFNNFRLSLLEQVIGARFLENNSDLGDETERIFAQYLGRRLGNSVRILRGGHIYDYEDNRSDQIDIIITPANALGVCPADTDDGKYNVVIDQVIAAISVTSRLTPEKFRKRKKELERIPSFKEKEKTYPGMKDQPWPLCYIVGAECEDLNAIENAWGESGFIDKPPIMALLLDTGYIMKRTGFPKAKGPGIPERIDDLHRVEGIRGGLGLGWLETHILSRNWWMTNQRADWVTPLQEQLHKLEGGDPPLYDQKRETFFLAGSPIHGILKWGYSGWRVHNLLTVTSILVNDLPNKDEATLLDPNKPIQRVSSLERFKTEPRWFKEKVHAINGEYCALEEWVDPQDRVKHQRRITVFDSRTGEDVTSKLTKPIAECSEIEWLNPVLR